MYLMRQRRLPIASAIPRRANGLNWQPSGGWRTVLSASSPRGGHDSETSPKTGEFPELGLIVSQPGTLAYNHVTTGENADATVRAG